MNLKILHIITHFLCNILLPPPSYGQKAHETSPPRASLRQPTIQNFISAEIIFSSQCNFNSLILCPRTRRQDWRGFPYILVIFMSPKKKAKPKLLN